MNLRENIRRRVRAREEYQNLGHVSFAKAYKAYQYARDFLPKNSKSTMRQVAYPTPTTGNRKRKLSFSAGTVRGGAQIRRRLFTGRSQRRPYLKAVGKRTSRKSRRGRRAGPSSMKKKGPSFTSGPYTGAFKKARKVPRSMAQTCLSQGYCKTIEQYGFISDPDACYITHSTHYLNELGYTITYALLRKIMNKAGFRVTNREIELPVTDPGAGPDVNVNSGGLRFVFTVKNQTTGLLVESTYDTVDGQSFTDICTNSGFMSSPIINYLRNSNVEEPYKVAVYKLDFWLNVAVPVSAWRLGAEMYLQDAHLKLFLDSTLTLQNRTLGAADSGVLAESDRVDNQPIKGWIYNFKHGEPRVKHSGDDSLSTTNNNMFNRVGVNGLSLIRAAQYSLADPSPYTGAREPLVPKYFANIDKAIPILLQPGEMKTTKVSHNFSGSFTNLFKRLRVENYDSPSLSISGVPGRSQMLCFEETLRTVTGNYVKLSYERHLELGCIVDYKWKPAPVETTLVTEVISNTAP